MAVWWGDVSRVTQTPWWSLGLLLTWPHVRRRCSCLRRSWISTLMAEDPGWDRAGGCKSQHRTQNGTQFKTYKVFLELPIQYFQTVACCGNCEVKVQIRGMTVLRCHLAKRRRGWVCAEATRCPCWCWLDAARVLVPAVGKGHGWHSQGACCPPPETA